MKCIDITLENTSGFVSRVVTETGRYCAASVGFERRMKRAVASAVGVGEPASGRRGWRGGRGRSQGGWRRGARTRPAQVRVRAGLWKFAEGELTWETRRAVKRNATAGGTRASCGGAECWTTEHVRWSGTLNDRTRAVERNAERQNTCGRAECRTTEHVRWSGTLNDRTRAVERNAERQNMCGGAERWTTEHVRWSGTLRWQNMCIGAERYDQGTCAVERNVTTDGIRARGGTERYDDTTRAVERKKYDRCDKSVCSLTVYHFVQYYESAGAT